MYHHSLLYMRESIHNYHYFDTLHHKEMVGLHIRSLLRRYHTHHRRILDLGRGLDLGLDLGRGLILGLGLSRDLEEVEVVHMPRKLLSSHCYQRFHLHAIRILYSRTLVRFHSYYTVQK